MAPITDRRRTRATCVAWVLLVTALTSTAACERMDCKNIATTGCSGSTLYDVYNRPNRD